MVLLWVGVLIADRAHLPILVLLVGRDADVGGNLHGVFGHPNRIAIQYITEVGQSDCSYAATREI